MKGKGTSYNNITTVWNFAVSFTLSTGDRHTTEKMLYHKLACVVAFTAGVLANPAHDAKGNGDEGAAAAAASATATIGVNGGTGLTLDTAAVQTGSFVDGSTSIGAEAGQAKSQTS